MPEYQVVKAFPDHTGRVRHAGAKVTMTERQARHLLIAGFLGKLEAAAPTPAQGGETRGAAGRPGARGGKPAAGVEAEASEEK
jgi:hypothetical protein